MMAVQASHGVRGSMSFTSDEIDLMNAPFHAPVVDGIAQTSTTPRLTSPGPLALPSFVFPAKPSPLSSSAPSSFSRATGRRPASIASPTLDDLCPTTQLDRDSLPAFSFGNKQLSPPTSPRSITNRPGFHKRGTSEYIGGDGATGSGQLLSVSPTKGDGSLPAPSVGAAATAAGRRRGHAHRRSAAISCGDLSVILKPNSGLPRSGSAPTTPNVDYQVSPLPATVDSTDPGTRLPMEDPEKDSQTIPAKSLKNTRVGFSDDVQIIPRPLSVVSSDSSSTARPGHSVSNSISSVISSGTQSPQSRERRSSSSLATIRPRTAEPLTDRETLSEVNLVPRRRGSLPHLVDSVGGSSSIPSTPRSAKRWSFFGLETTSGESSPKSRPTSSASSAKDSKPVDITVSTPAEPSIHVPLPSLERSSSRQSSISRKPGKKQKKVKSWAGSILSRKSRQRSQKPKLSRRSPTPPLRSFAPVDEQRTASDSNVAGDGIAAPTVAGTDFTNWQPRKFSPQEDSMSPVIDLDAALGPFNTPTAGFGDDWEYVQRGGKSVRRRAMHSAAGLGGFSGPGMHYHRRAESAPEFENPRFGLHRLGSSSTMAMEDVFEEDEDEDEDWEDAKAPSDIDTNVKSRGTEGDDTGLGIDITVDDSEAIDTTESLDTTDSLDHRGVKRKGSGLSEGDRWHMSSAKSINSTASLVDLPIPEATINSVEIFDDSLLHRSDSGAQSSDSTATPPSRPKQAKDLAPVDVQSFALQPPYPTPTSPYSTTQYSFPSPRSPFSYDTQRISTTPSSIVEENTFQSLLLGEPGPELRMSVDDVPSLTSSNSGTTRDLPFSNIASARLRDGQRSASLSAASAINRKRSSIASLSRLISSSHGEKSKLSIEAGVSGIDEADRKDKASKGKRLSRMIQFWKKPNDS